MKPTASSLRRAAAWTVVVVALVLNGSVPGFARASDPPSASVEGTVVDWTNAKPIAGARVRLPDYGLETRSGPDGSFRFAEPLATRRPLWRIRAVVTAPGFGRWSVSGLPLPPGDTLRIRAELRERSWSHMVTDGPAKTTRRPRPVAVATGNTCTGWNAEQVPPPTIKVYLHEEATSRQYDFYFYAAHVLPSEWIPSWDADALAAGAVAVKTYAWYRTLAGHAYSSGSGCADVRDDTSDQVFDPSYSLASTDQAVYVSMGSVLRRSGHIFLAQYWSGSSSNSSQDWKRCEYVDEGPFAGRMSQWGTQVCAQEGRLWPDIDRVFYPDTTWKWLRNLILNPSLEGNVGTTYWGAGSTTTATRTNAQAPYSGNWYLLVTPTPAGKWAQVRQTHPIVGSGTSQYHAQAALRCTDSNATACSISIRVGAIPSSGGTVYKTVTVTVPKDHRWHVVTYDPPAAGIQHGSVTLVFGSKQEFKLDASLLNTPYGGA